MRHQAAKRTNPRKHTKSRTVLRLVNLKVSPPERKRLDAAARKYAGGNLSAWLRFAGVAFRPSQAALQKLA